MITYLMIALGGALGSVARFWMSGLIAERFDSKFPWGTIFVNITGSFLIGIFAALSELRPRVPAGGVARAPARERAASLRQKGAKSLVGRLRTGFPKPPRNPSVR
jgi:fluoride ion exporter CrcB/FEX